MSSLSDEGAMKKNNAADTAVGEKAERPADSDNVAVAGYAIVGCSPQEKTGGGAKLNIPPPPPHHLRSSDSSQTVVAVLSLATMEDILGCLERGVNVIGTDLPTKWSLSHQALVLPLDYRKKFNEEDDNASTIEECFLLDLTDTKYAMDRSPILEGCTCMACQQDYSRAYIHHLYQAKELLAQILLMGHNLHHMLEFCRVATQVQQQQDNHDDDRRFDTFLQRCKTYL